VAGAKGGEAEVPSKCNGNNLATSSTIFFIAGAELEILYTLIILPRKTYFHIIKIVPFLFT